MCESKGGTEQRGVSQGREQNIFNEQGEYKNI